MDFLFTVTDNQLMATKYVTFIFLLILLFGIVINVRQLIGAKTPGQRMRKVLFIAVFAGLLYPVYAIFDIESSLLGSERYVPGTTTGFCKVPALGDGVEFEYHINGVLYSACNTYHPIPKDSIVVPNGRYYVRYSEKYPEEGRIDLSRPVIASEQNESMAAQAR